MEEYYVYIESTGEILTICDSYEEAMTEAEYASGRIGESVDFCDAESDFGKELAAQLAMR